MSDVTRILSKIESGDEKASDDLLPLVYDELRKIAAARMSQERSDFTLQATALVHEAYLRLVDTDMPQRWESRRHFFAAAAEAMRRILVERARKRSRREELQGGRVPLDDLRSATDCPPDQFLTLNDALSRLEAENSTAAAIVKLRFFAGLTVAQAASTLDLPVRTAERKWAFARTWLHRDLEDFTD